MATSGAAISPAVRAGEDDEEDGMPNQHVVTAAPPVVVVTSPSVPVDAESVSVSQPDASG
jgi:hypothetical protein